MTIRVLQGDMLEVLPKLNADSIDSCVTDPPYHLTSIVKRFGSDADLWRIREIKSPVPH